ncbi:MAG: IS1380 family transposase [Candidatus Dormibacteria bacterium]
MWVLKSTIPTREGITLRVKFSDRPRLGVSADGAGLVSRAGSRLLAELAERSGLEREVSRALVPLVRRRRRHDPGRVLVDLAVTLADGGECITDLAQLRQQPDLFGQVASTPTAWRLLDSIEEPLLERLALARARARARAWGWGMAPKRVTLDFDSTLVEVESENKEQAAPNWKHGFGFHPLLVYLDETGEAVAGELRPGNAGSNTAQDHVALLDAALRQLPMPTRAEDPEPGPQVLVRSDSAGASHGFVGAVSERGLEFSVGFDVTEPVREAILNLPDQSWVGAITKEMEEREGAQVAEITALLDLSSWPTGSRVLVRREEPHPGASYNLFDPNGLRHQALITNSKDPDLAYLEARHRLHARVEDRIKEAKECGLSNFPCSSFRANRVWLLLVQMAQDLLAWARRLCFKGEFREAAPKRLRHQLLHVAGRLVCSGRRRTLRLDARWPWAVELATAFLRLRALPLTT